MELKGKVALITGGAVRLGRALALALAGQGVRIALHYGTSTQAAEATAAEINALGSEARLFPADLRDTAGLAPMLARAAQAWGTVDILVNSAAMFEPGGLADTTEANWEAHFAVNLKAPFFLAQAWAAQLKPGQRGHLVNLVDWRAVRPGPNYLAYTLTKAALLTLTHSLAVALAPQVQVNAIAPGAILPPPGQPETYFNRLLPRIPLGRPGAPADVAQALLFLVQSDFVTGETLFVTGGEHL